MGDSLSIRLSVHQIYAPNEDLAACVPQHVYILPKAFNPLVGELSSVTRGPVLSVYDPF